MKKQRGVAISGLLFWGILIGLVAILAVKASPALIEYYKIKKSVVATAGNSSGRTVAEIRRIFDNYAIIDHIESVTPADLEISKEGGAVVIEFSYEKRVPLFANVSLLFEFSGSSSGREKVE